MNPLDLSADLFATNASPKTKSDPRKAKFRDRAAERRAGIQQPQVLKEEETEIKQSTDKWSSLVEQILAMEKKKETFTSSSEAEKHRKTIETALKALQTKNEIKIEPTSSTLTPKKRVFFPEIHKNQSEDDTDEHEIEEKSEQKAVDITKSEEGLFGYKPYLPRLSRTNEPVAKPDLSIAVEELDDVDPLTLFRNNKTKQKGDSEEDDDEEDYAEPSEERLSSRQLFKRREAKLDKQLKAIESLQKRPKK